MLKIFSLVPSKKPVTRENWGKLSVYFSIFEWFTVIPKKSIWHLAICKIGVLVNSIIKKLKSKHLVCLSFLWWQVFMRELEKISYTYSGSLRRFRHRVGTAIFFRGVSSLFGHKSITNWIHIISHGFNVWVRLLLHT